MRTTISSGIGAAASMRSSRSSAVIGPTSCMNRTTMSGTSVTSSVYLRERGGGALVSSSSSSSSSNW